MLSIIISEKSFSVNRYRIITDVFISDIHTMLIS